MPRDAVRAGQSLVELVVALFLLALLGSTAIGLLSAELALVRQAADATEAGNAIRFAARLLHAEMGPLVGIDFHGLATDSSRQRVFRGTGTVCGVTTTSAVIRYVGLRHPDPAKDSVLALTPEGEIAKALLASSVPAPPPCVPRPGEAVLELTVAGGLRPGDVVLLFETGTWHLSSSALRYARGAGGRQPLTPAVLVDDSTGMSADTSGTGPVAVRVALAALPAGIHRASRMLRDSFRIALLNLAQPLDSVVLE